ncbi:MAG: hypothetical protein V3R20_04530 [Sphingomonadales bacterium]
MIKLKSKSSAPIRKKAPVPAPTKAKPVAPNRPRPKAVGPIKNRNKYEYWVEFDLRGEKEVREKLEGGKYGGGRLEAAVEWLSTKENYDKREKKRDADVQKALRAARIAQVASAITGVFAITIGIAALYFYFS